MYQILADMVVSFLRNPWVCGCAKNISCLPPSLFEGACSRAQTISYHRYTSPRPSNPAYVDISACVSYCKPRVSLSSAQSVTYRFWGALSDSAKLTPNYNAWFVNRDAARIGNTLAQSFLNSTAPGQQLGWIDVDPQTAGSDQDIIKAVIENGPWIVVVGACLRSPASMHRLIIETVEANATTNLVLARENGDKTYNPESAITVYYAQASTGSPFLRRYDELIAVNDV